MQERSGHSADYRTLASTSADSFARARGAPIGSPPDGGQVDWNGNQTNKSVMGIYKREATVDSDLLLSSVRLLGVHKDRLERISHRRVER
jgi:hypothetical protein